MAAGTPATPVARDGAWLTTLARARPRHAERAGARGRERRPRSLAVRFAAAHRATATGSRHEQAPEDWWDAVAGACRDGAAPASRPCCDPRGRASAAPPARSCSSTSDGDPLTDGLMYDDTRAGAEAELVNEAGAGPVGAARLLAHADRRGRCRSCCGCCANTATRAHGSRTSPTSSTAGSPATRCRPTEPRAQDRLRPDRRGVADSTSSSGSAVPRRCAPRRGPRRRPAGNRLRARRRRRPAFPPARR